MKFPPDGHPKVWKDISGYEGRYRVSNHGEVFSALSDIILKGFLSPSGYVDVALHKDGKQRTHTIHTLVAAAHVPNPAGKPWVNHIDSNRANNHARNLEWCTPQENILHGYAHGRSKGPGRAFTDEQAATIRARRAAGCRQVDLAEEYGVSHTTIKSLIRGQHYRAKVPL